jgi:hypothetical protein
MTHVYIVQGEHPHHPYYPLEVYASPTAAAAYCAELTKEFLTDWWEIHREDEPMPEVTVKNWTEVVEEYGDVEDEIQDDGFGRWWVEMDAFNVR